MELRNKPDNLVSRLTLVSLSLFSWRMALAQMKMKIPMPMVKGPSIFILSERRCCSRNLVRAPPPACPVTTRRPGEEVSHGVPGGPGGGGGGGEPAPYLSWCRRC